MACPDCASTATTRRKGRTALGYRRFRCQACRRRFNERTGTPFNDLQYPTNIVLLAVLWRRPQREPRALVHRHGAHGLRRAHPCLRRPAHRGGPLQTRDHPLAQALRRPRALPLPASPRARLTTDRSIRTSRFQYEKETYQYGNQDPRDARDHPDRQRALMSDSFAYRAARLLRTLLPQ